jgi:hypothetical protein
MTERKSLFEQALDVCLYAPVGLAISVTEELPQLIDKGRARVNSQLTMAKMVGSFAVAQGQREAERVVRQATSRVSEGGGPFGPPQAREAGSITPPGEAPDDPDAAPWTTPAGVEPTDGDGAGAATMVDDTSRSDGATAAIPSASPAPDEDPLAPAPAPAMPAGDASSLAIPGYDALSASQVVQRLAGLATDELEAVRTYEAATRGRRTILNRIAQLQGPGRS